MAVNLVVIDLGSNSVRLQISQIDEFGGFDVMTYDHEYVRLSENMGPEKTLKEEPMKRTLSALKKFKGEYSKLPHVVIKAVATAAVRQAKNQKDFLNRVHKQIGLDLKVIPGETEAFLDYLGVINTLPVRNSIIMDTGGASTELIWVKNGQCAERVSVPIGSVLLSQGFNLSNTVSAADLYQAMNAASHFISAVPWLGQVHNLPLIALGGSNRTIAKIRRRQLSSNVDEVPDIHGMHLSAQYIFKLMSQLLGMNEKQRMGVPGLGKKRADVIIGGLIPISLILRNLQIGEVVFSSHGLRDGLLYDYLTHQQKSRE